MRLQRALRGVSVGRLAGPVRATDAEADGPRRIEGTSAPYDSWTVLIDNPRYRLRERYARGCFDESLESGSDVRCCFNHDRNIILGRLSNGTLRLDPKGDGLTYSVDLNAEDPIAMAVHSRVKRGDVVGGSTWFIPIAVNTTRETVEGQFREDDTIVRADLWEQGPVIDGAYEDTDAAARACMRAAGISDRDYNLFEREIRGILAGGG